MNNRIYKVSLPTVLFLILALGVYMTMVNPTFWRIDSCLYGTKSDNFATLWGLWALNLGEGDFTHLVNFPFGKSLERNFLDFLTILPTASLASISNEVFAFNFILFLSFLLSGFFTYILVSLLTRQATPSFICGLAYMILPYHLAISQYHFTLARIEVFPLFLITLVWFLRHLKWYNAGWILLAQFASFAINPHYGLFNFLILIAFLSARLFYHPDKGWSKPTLGRLGSTFVLEILAAATGLPQYLSQTIPLGNAEVVFSKPFEQLYSYSARVGDYFLPPVQHPLLGKLTSGFIMSHIHDSYVHEQTLYLGWVVILLATIGAWYLWCSQNYEHRFFGVFLLIISLGGFLFSLPPIISLFGHQVPLPGLFLHYIFPVFRVYARFGMIVATAFIILAGFGIIWVLERFRAKRTVAILITGLILFEFINVPPAHFVDLRKAPPVYQWLSQQEGVQAIAEYPLGFPPEKAGEHLNLWDVYEYMLWQRVHRKPLFNGEPQMLLDLAMKLQLSDSSKPNTPARLHWLGISHLMLHKESMDQRVLEALEQNKDLKAVYSDEQVTVFHIVGNTAYFLPEEFKYPQGMKAKSLSDSQGAILLPVLNEGSSKEILLVYGPYIALPEGQYKVQFMLSAVQEEGFVRLVVNNDSGQTALAEKKFNLGMGANPTIEFYTQGTSSVEFRLYGQKAILLFAGVVVEKLS